jgi:hypothetical protein
LGQVGPDSKPGQKKKATKRKAATAIPVAPRPKPKPKPAAGVPVCIGNSHMACVLEAAEQQGVELAAIVFKHARYFDGLKQRPVEAHVKEVPAIGDNPVHSFIGGTRYLSLGLGMLEHPRPYDFVLRSHPDLPIEPATELIPLEAMRRVLEDGIGIHLRLFEGIAKVAKGPVYHYEPPPPPRAPSVAVKTGKGRQPAADDAVAGQPWLRFKLWRLHSEIVKNHAEGCGAVFVDCPEAAFDGDGFLRPDLILNATHANAAYGALVLEQIRRLAAS